MYRNLRLGTARSGRYTEIGGCSLLGGSLMCKIKCKKNSIPELVSAIWSESANGDVRYRRFHCISPDQYVLL